MNRNKAYYRRMRKGSIKRKKRLSEYYHWDVKCDSILSKGKIHCSCAMCSTKTRNKRYNLPDDWKHSDLLKIQEMDDALKEYATLL